MQQDSDQWMHLKVPGNLAEQSRAELQISQSSPVSARLDALHFLAGTQLLFSSFSYGPIFTDPRQFHLLWDIKTGELIDQLESPSDFRGRVTAMR